uniref:C2H2-type domain-containing protein n=1 Tax=Eucampia antarctica TaxID=49252 RepID=A0A7S2R8F1_9STRA|mmetsp:Transcript_18110/g.17480  ORF Transcript_18110/g.17480 Transcript_18110/m.17480 type:complete len:185 (+) Transcript_18110:180-734(+)
MGRTCSECADWKSNSQFSSNQWRKGDGASRCRDCIDYGSSAYAGHCHAVTFQCGTCSRTFNNQNELNMHQQVHRPQNVACPVCGDVRFRSGANAVQHVESGSCTGCRGQDNARQQIYKFATAQQSMRRFVAGGQPMLMNGNDYNNNSIPDFPYQCPQCSKSFRQLSQLLQHNDQKHNQHNMIGY